MFIFFTLLWKIIPLYILIILGFVAGKYFHVKKESIASLVIYIVSPVIFFNAAATTPLNFASISFPILCFFLCMGMALLFYFVGQVVFKNNTKNILSYVCAMGNIGYFGLPVALAVLPKEYIGPYLLGVLGMNVFDVSGAYFIVAHGTHTIGESIKRVLVLQTLYTFFVGIMIQVLHIPLGSIYTDTITSFKGAYVILGMMLVGLGISSMAKFSFDWLFLGITYVAKFIVWPLLALGIIFADNMWFHIFPPGLHQSLLLLAIVPVAANSVAYSTQFNLHPERAAVAVVSSTVVGLIYIPLFVAWYVK